MLQKNLKILIKEKEVEIEKIFVSELGFTMIKTKNPDGTFTSYNVGKMNPKDNPFTNLIYSNYGDIRPSRGEA